MTVLSPYKMVGHQAHMTPIDQRQEEAVVGSLVSMRRWVSSV